MPALVPAVIDVPLTPLNQVPPDTAGPLGRLKTLINAQIEHFEPHYTGTAGVVPAKVRVEPRDAFVSVVATARSIIDGSSVTPTWINPELLSPLGDQLVAISDAIPRVYNGNTWTYYGDTRVLTQKLTSDVFHTSQRTIGPDDYAVIGSTKCCVWTEIQNTSTGQLTTSYVGFKAKNGAWLVQPTPLYTSVATTVITQARVVQDGVNFFVVFNTFTSISVHVYDQHGALLGTDASTIPLPSPTTWPGPWDVTAAPTSGGYTALLAALVNTNADNGVDTYAVKWTGSAVSINHVRIGSSTIHASFRLAFLVNDTQNGKAYLATMAGGDGSQIYAYEITNQAVTITYDTGVSPTGIVDSITGYVTSSSGAAVIVSYSLLSTLDPASGPKSDPQLRQMHSFATVAPNITTQIRTTQSLTQVSRAFAIDSEWYSIGYYQSGAGTVWAPTTVNVTPAIGDYMYGAAQQPLAVSAGDKAIGSAIALASSAATAGPTIRVTDSSSAVSIVAGDSAAAATVTGLSSYGIPDGSLLIKWKFANLAATTNSVGSRITVSGSSIASLNSTWDVVALDSTGTYFYTLTNDINGNFATSVGTFTTAGTVQRIAMVGYETQNLAPYISGQTVGPFIGGTFVVAGASSSNNGTFTARRVYYGDGPNYGYGTAATGFGVVWVTKTTQSTETHTFTATLTPVGVNQWTFTAGDFDFTDIGAQLVITDDPAQPSNVGTYTITSVQSPTTFTTGSATAILPQVFTASGATAEIQLTTQVPYTFAFGAVTADFSYLGAIVSVQGAYAPNNGTYKIVQVNADGSFVATPTNGLSNQINEGFGPSQTVTIFLNPVQAPQVQPTWFLVPMGSKQPIAGKFELGLAYSDWRTEAGATPTLFPFALTSPQVTADGVEFVLPYRAESITSASAEVTSAGVVDLGQPTYTSTVGLKTFTLSNDTGQPFASNGELLIPGPLASTFSASGFSEDNTLAPEQPFLVSQSAASSGQLSLTKGGIYFYQVVYSNTTESGTAYSPPSPALQVNLSGNNNVAVISGRLLYPLDTTGKPIANTYGPTTRPSNISIYRTAFINGEPTKQHFKVTLDDQVNGLAPYSTTNNSGFSFPDSFTWVFQDQTTDADLTANEILYVDKNYLPRYSAPAFTVATSWRNRLWCIGYDGAVWFSAEATEGDHTWWNPAFRFPFAIEDRPLTLAPMDDYLIVFCQRSIYYIPASDLPGPTGLNGSGGFSLPNTVRLPFQNGSANGYAITIREGVAYDSTAGGIWLITRNLDNQWLSHPVMDTLTNPVIGLALDESQRLLVIQGGSSLAHVYDGVPGAWYQWQFPTSPLLAATSAGKFVYQDAANVNAASDAGADTIAGVTTAIAPDLTLAPLNYGNTRGLKRVWAFQAVGSYLGPHNLNVVLSYNEDDVPDTTYGPFPAVAGKAYVYEFNPAQEEASQYGIRIYADFNGIMSPGKSFALEVVSSQVGMDSVGINKRPSYVTLKKR